MKAIFKGGPMDGEELTLNDGYRRFQANCKNCHFETTPKEIIVYEKSQETTRDGKVIFNLVRKETGEPDKIKLLFNKYINHVVSCEGIDYLGTFCYSNKNPFTEEEMKILEEIKGMNNTKTEG